MNVPNVVPEAAGHTLLRRRDFLVLGSAGLATLCLGDLAWADPLLTGAALPLPVAYVDGSGGLRGLKHLPSSVLRPGMAERSATAETLTVLAADRLPEGDTSLVGRPLRMRIHGLYPPATLNPQRRTELPVSIDLDVVFPPPDPAFPAPAPFHAWSLRRSNGWNPSPPVSFVFPLDWYVYPELVMTVVPSEGGRPVTMRTLFTLDDEPGRPRLQRGLFLLGLLPGAWRAEGALRKLGGKTPAELFSVLISMESEPGPEEEQR